MDFNDFVEAFADLVADKVTRRLNANDWPNIETKVEQSLTAEEIRKRLPGSNPITEEPLIEFPEQPDIDPQPVKVGNDYQTKRLAELNRIDIRVLRRRIATVEDKDVADYAHLKKDQLVKYVYDFEAVIGRTLEAEESRQLSGAGFKTDELEDDNDLSIPDPEDDTDSDVLTREQAEGLDLADLKKLAIDNDVPEEDLKGLDVEAVLDLLYGSEAVEEAAEAQPEVSEDETEEVDITEDEIKVMSIGELKALAADLNEQGAKIKVTRISTRGELIKDILDNLEFEDG